MLSKLLFAALLAVLAYKAFGWWRQWRRSQELASPTRQSPLDAGDDLRHCARCDRYIDAAALSACRIADCPMKGR